MDSFVIRFHGIPVDFGNPFHRSFDRGYGPLLGDNKGNQHFPGLLTQNTKPGTAGGRFFHIGIRVRNLTADLTVTAVQMKIRAPEIPPLGFCAANLIETGFRLLYV